jgi:2-polyprenyl-3-methyl-5-hydroxy-6-metoxy-1,4-benzoquinol methylase
LAPWQEIDRFLNYLEPTAPRVSLDIGCGSGQLSRELYHRGFSVVGIDASASALRIAQSLTVVPRQQLSYFHFDIEQDDTAKLLQQPYSLITCKLVYAFIKDKAAFLDSVAQLLTPHGIFVVITPLPEDVPSHRRSIASNKSDLELLSLKFSQAALYKDHGYLHFIGKKLS